MANTLDILKIQKTITKSIENYKIESKHGKNALVALMSVDLYLALEEREAPAQLPKPKPLTPNPEVTVLGQTAKCN